MMKKAVALLALFGAVCTADESGGDNPAETCPDEYTACTGDAVCRQLFADEDMAGCGANALCAPLLQCAMGPCADQAMACAGDADCGAILNADEFDMSACMANTLCAEMMNCQAQARPCGDQSMACVGDADCGAIVNADVFDTSACMANALCAEVMNCNQAGSGGGGVPEPRPPAPPPPPPVVIEVAIVTYTEEEAATAAASLATALAAPAEADAAVAPAPKVAIAATVGFPISIDTIADGPERAQFEDDFKTSMAGSIGGGAAVSADKIIVDAITAARRRLQVGGASVSVDFHIDAPASLQTEAASLVAAVDTSSITVGGATASAISAPVVTAPPDVDCVGAWDQCSASCDDKIYRITTVASGSGAACGAAHYDTAACNPGDGQCPVVNCAGEWSSCGADCGDKTYTVTTPAAGGSACAAADGDTAACEAGMGACPPAPAPAKASSGTSTVLTVTVAAAALALAL